MSDFTKDVFLRHSLVLRNSPPSRQGFCSLFEAGGLLICETVLSSKGNREEGNESQAMVLKEAEPSVSP